MTLLHINQVTGRYSGQIRFVFGSDNCRLDWVIPVFANDLYIVGLHCGDIDTSPDLIIEAAEYKVVTLDQGMMVVRKGQFFKKKKFVGLIETSSEWFLQCETV